jgi:DNA repair protein RecO (recombination protein O)
MKSIKLTGIILKKSKVKENDQRITFFSRELGKVSFIAPGSSKITSRRVGQLDSLNVISVNLTPHHSMYYLKEVDLVSMLEGIKRSYEKRAALLMVLEILEKLLPVEQPEESIYEFVKRFLVELDRGEGGAEFVKKHLQQLSQLLGYGQTPLPQFVQEMTNRPLSSLQLL